MIVRCFPFFLIAVTSTGCGWPLVLDYQICQTNNCCANEEKPPTATTDTIAIRDSGHSPAVVSGSNAGEAVESMVGSTNSLVGIMVGVLLGVSVGLGFTAAADGEFVGKAVGTVVGRIGQLPVPSVIVSVESEDTA